jgi:hypothetical protein
MNLFQPSIKGHFIYRRPHRVASYQVTIKTPQYSKTKCFTTIEECYQWAEWFDIHGAPNINLSSERLTEWYEEAICLSSK